MLDIMKVNYQYEVIEGQPTVMNFLNRDTLEVESEEAFLEVLETIKHHEISVAAVAFWFDYDDVTKFDETTVDEIKCFIEDQSVFIAQYTMDVSPQTVAFEHFKEIYEDESKILDKIGLYTDFVKYFNRMGDSVEVFYVEGECFGIVYTK